jgi:L-fuconolactonase
MIQMMDEAGVDRAVLVPRAPTVEQNDFCLAAAEAHPGRLAVMGRIATDVPLSAAELGEWAARPGMLGIRLGFGQPAARQQLDDHVVDWLWPVAEEVGVPLYVLPPGRVRYLGEIAERHPGLRFAIDHLGLHTSLRDEAILPEVDAVLSLAELPNVAVKASALPAYVTESYPFRSLHDVVRRVFDAYGSDRVFWGSDVTRLRCSYREAVTMFTMELGFLADEDLDRVMGQGLLDWLGWA